MPERLEKLKHWLAERFSTPVATIEPASSDASFRRYFRVRFSDRVFELPPDETYIAMDAPPDKENIESWLAVDRFLGCLGLNAPSHFASDREQGFVLLSDLGTTPFLKILDEQNADKLYSDALSSLLIMQLGYKKQNDLVLPPYDEKLLRMEMELVREWYIKRHLGHDLTTVENKIIDDALTLLVKSALEQPTVFVHRDYHSRNLMYVNEHNPGIIDFQDAVAGPITYDLVSLFRDSYVSWPEERVAAWVEQYRQMLLREQLLTEDNKGQFERWFDWMGLQRQLKVVGIFSRLNYRDGKENYLLDIPQTLAYLYRTAEHYDEFADLYHLISDLSSMDRNGK